MRKRKLHVNLKFLLQFLFVFPPDKIFALFTILILFFYIAKEFPVAKESLFVVICSYFLFIWNSQQLLLSNGISLV